MDVSFFATTFVALLAGLPVTLLLSFGAVFFGAVLAIGVTALRLSGSRPCRFGAWCYVQTIRSVPLLAILFVLYFGLSQFAAVRHSLFWVILKDPYWCALIGLALKASAYASEVFRGGLLAVPSGDVLAARSVGMSGLKLYRRIIVPVGLRLALPAYGNEIIVMVKATSLASLVTVMDITGIANSIASETFRPMQVLLVAAVIYLGLNSVISLALSRLERRVMRHLRTDAINAYTDGA